MAFNPIHNHFIKFHSGSFNQGFPIGANLIQDCFAHNLEWIYGTGTDFLVNYNTSTNLKGFRVLRPSDTSYVPMFSFGPFPIRLNKEKKPLPIYIEYNAGANGSGISGNITASIIVDLRYYGNTSSYGGSDRGYITAISGSGGTNYWAKISTPSSSFGATSSILHFPSGIPPQYFDIGAIDPGYVSSSNTHYIAMGMIDLYGKVSSYTTANDYIQPFFLGFMAKEINTKGTGSL